MVIIITERGAYQSQIIVSCLINSHIHLFTYSGSPGRPGSSCRASVRAERSRSLSHSGHDTVLPAPRNPSSLNISGIES